MTTQNNPTQSTETQTFSPKELAKQQAEALQVELEKSDKELQEKEDFRILDSLTAHKINTVNLLSVDALALIADVPTSSEKNGIIYKRVDFFANSLQVRPSQIVKQSQVETLKASFKKYYWDISKGMVRVAKNLLGHENVLVSGNHRITAIAQMINDSAAGVSGCLPAAKVKELALIPVYYDIRKDETAIIFDAIAENVGQYVLSNNDRLLTYAKNAYLVVHGSNGKGGKELLRVSGLQKEPNAVAQRVAKWCLTNESLYNYFLAEKFNVDNAKQVLSTLCELRNPIATKEVAADFFVGILDCLQGSLDKKELNLQLAAKVKELAPERAKEATLPQNSGQTPNSQTVTPKPKDGEQKNIGTKGTSYDLQTAIRDVARNITAIYIDLCELKATNTTKAIEAALSQACEMLNIAIDKAAKDAIQVPYDKAK